MTERTEQLISMFLQTPFTMTEQQACELSNWIAQDAGHTREFIQASLFRRCIREVLLDSDVERKHILFDDLGNYEQLWQMLSNEEQTAPEVEVAESEPQQELIRNVQRPKTIHTFNKTTFLTAVGGIAAMILLLTYVYFVPNPAKVEVATLTSTVHAEWAESASLKSSNVRLVTNHEPLMLRKGCAELVFDNNAKVVLEAPVEFQVLSYDQIKLSYGRLYATVPKEAVGFIVSTPTSKIIDLGTEFGVQTDFNGATELYVVKGKTSLMSGSAANGFSLLLNAGAAKKVSAMTSSPTDIVYDEQIFVRQINPKSQFLWRGQNVSLADIVGGGNGFGGGVISRGIDVRTGTMVSRLVSEEPFMGSEGYYRVPENKYVDGVFVPGLNGDRTQLASDGSASAVFPKTSGVIWGYIFDGAMHKGITTPEHSLKLENVVLGTLSNPAICIHSNQGITFDLAAIRSDLSGLKIRSFRSRVGISQTVQNCLERERDRSFADPTIKKVFDANCSKAEFWVFVDGVKVYQKEMSSRDGADQFDIPIDPSGRFLTLAVTESDDTQAYDWALFAQPELVLESAENQDATRKES